MLAVALTRTLRGGGRTSRRTRRAHRIRAKPSGRAHGCRRRVPLPLPRRAQVPRAVPVGLVLARDRPAPPRPGGGARRAAHPHARAGARRLPAAHDPLAPPRPPVAPLPLLAAGSLRPGHAHDPAAVRRVRVGARREASPDDPGFAREGVEALGALHGWLDRERNPDALGPRRPDLARRVRSRRVAQVRRAHGLARVGPTRVPVAHPRAPARRLPARRTCCAAADSACRRC